MIQKVEPQRLLYRVSEAAQVLGINRNLVYEMIWSGELRTVRIGKRGRRIPVVELQRWIEENMSDEYVA